MWNGQKNMAARKKTELVETFSFGPWSINAKKGPIITTAECERYDLITYVTVFFSFFSTTFQHPALHWHWDVYGSAEGEVARLASSYAA